MDTGGRERGLRVCWRQIPQNLRGNEGEAGRKKRKAMSTKNEVDNVIIREYAHDAGKKTLFLGNQINSNKFKR